MFRIDDDFVVDATVHGNAARFINHCCEVSLLHLIFYGHQISVVKIIQSEPIFNIPKGKTKGLWGHSHPMSLCFFAKQA